MPIKTLSAGYEPVQDLLSMPPPVTPVTPVTPFAPVIASAAPVTAPAAAPVVSNTPPIPAGGLPAGWTMEQWEHYGEQWLAQNMTVAQPALGLHPQPTSSNVEGDLSDLLDDIGL